MYREDGTQILRPGTYSPCHIIFDE